MLETDNATLSELNVEENIIDSKKGSDEIPAISEETLNKEKCELMIQWNAFVDEHSPDTIFGRDYFIHNRNLYEAFNRREKRRQWFKKYHRIDDVCEYRNVALLCYWLNRLKPFMVINEQSKIYNAPNERFSLYLMLLSVRGLFEEKNPGKRFEYPKSSFIKTVVYDMKYCDLGDEALVLFLETLARSYGVGMESFEKHTAKS